MKPSRSSSQVAVLQSFEPLTAFQSLQPLDSPAASLSLLRFLDRCNFCFFQLTTPQISSAQTVMAEEEDKTLVDILEEEASIDIIKYIEFVKAPQCGAIATFSGTTRDTFDDKTVVELRYEAYVPMAIRCLKSICSSARSTWSLNSIAVAHKLGSVPVGETSVFVAISSVHREDALDACKFLIDELKATVPIWKKEVYSNGEVWKENMEFLEIKDDLGKGIEKDELQHRKKGCCGVKIRVDDGREENSHGGS